MALSDLWASRDLPVLIATAELIENGRPPFTSNEIAAAAGLEQDQVINALRNLGKRFLIIGDASSMGGADYYARDITEAGLREVGQWPSPEVAADRLIAALEGLIDVAPEGSPKQSRLKAARDSLVSAGRDVLVEVAGAAITGRIPL